MPATRCLMVAINLSDEMHTAVGRVEQRHLNWMMGIGVPASAIAGLGKREEPFGIGFLEPVGTDYWQPIDEPAAIGAIIQPVYDDGDLIDLIAWRSQNPLDWRWRVGSAWALGADFLHGSVWDGFASIAIHATPLAWLAAGGEGLTVLNWTSPYIHQLSNFDEIVCNDSKLSSRLNKILSRPSRVPHIFSRVKQHEVA